MEGVNEGDREVQKHDRTTEISPRLRPSIDRGTCSMLVAVSVLSRWRKSLFWEKMLDLLRSCTKVKGTKRDAGVARRQRRGQTRSTRRERKTKTEKMTAHIKRKVANKRRQEKEVTGNGPRGKVAHGTKQSKHRDQAYSLWQRGRNMEAEQGQGEVPQISLS